MEILRNTPRRLGYGALGGGVGGGVVSLDNQPHLTRLEVADPSGAELAEQRGLYDLFEDHELVENIAAGSISGAVAVAVALPLALAAWSLISSRK